MRSATVAASLAFALSIASATDAHAQATAPQDRINAAMARAKQVGVPVSLLESKMAEGRAKGVSPERLAAAIERRLTALERASQALRGGADTAANLAVGADAIEAGVSESVLRSLAASAPSDRRNVAIAALTELVHQGQAPESALGRVQDALRRGPDALSNLPAESSGPGRSEGRQGGNSGNSRNSSSGQGGGNSGSGNSGNGKGTGARGGADSGPPPSVPAPGQPPQAGRPDNSGPGSDGNPGRGNSGGGNPGRGNSGGGNSGGGNSGGGGGGGNPGRGNQ